MVFSGGVGAEETGSGDRIRRSIPDMSRVHLLQDATLRFTGNEVVVCPLIFFFFFCLKEINNLQVHGLLAFICLSDGLFVVKKTRS
ncbi:hypothetical protein F2P81_001866 [Scophthalmus maximus]|uniref:Uncharacterized protein n=1 Tax=Scophthalmus maximus TaxID=52904 RepID=A0A6A4TFE1_SCOMX|nr:hypothetical protein F2P81_001866 [Scophthalmus maximus]